MKEHEELLLAFYEGVKDKESPLSCTITPKSFAVGLGWDLQRVRRAGNRCVNEQLMSSTLGLGILMLTQYGFNYAQDLAEGVNRFAPPVFNSNHIYIGGNAQGVQVLQGSMGAHQKQNVNSGAGSTPLKDLIDLIKQEFEDRSLNKEEAEVAAHAIGTLESQASKPELNKTLTKSALDHLGDIAKRVGSSLAANGILEYLKGLG